MAQAKMVITGDGKHLLREIDRLNKKIDGMGKRGEASAGKTRKSISGIGGAIDKAFSPARLAGMLAGFVSVQKAIDIIKAGLEDLARRREEAAQTIIETEMPAAKLAQLTKTHAEYRELLKTAGLIYEMGGAKTKEEAYATTFQLKSAGALKEAGFFARLKGVVPEIPEVAGAAAKIQAAFGVKETGTLEAIVGKGIAAAAPVTDVGVREMLLAATKPAKIAKKMGLSDEELLAAVSIVARGAEGPEVAGTQVKQMLTTFMTKPGFKGLSLQQMIEKVTQQQMPDPELKKWFGRIQGMQAYFALAGGEIPGRVGDIAAGAGEAQKRIDISMGRPEVFEPRALRVSKIASEVAMKHRARQEIRAQTVLEDLWRDEGGGLMASMRYASRKAILHTLGVTGLVNMLQNPDLAMQIIAGEGVQVSDEQMNRDTGIADPRTGLYLQTKDAVRDGMKEAVQQKTLAHPDDDPGR